MHDTQQRIQQTKRDGEEIPAVAPHILCSRDISTSLCKYAGMTVVGFGMTLACAEMTVT